MGPKLFPFLVLCFLFNDGFCEGTVVFAEEGSLAVLPCSADRQTVNPAVTWRTENGSVWKMQKNGLRFWSRRWDSRVRCPHTQFDRGDYSLQILSVRAEDAGTYSCLLELHDQRPVTTFITLRVLTVSVSPAAPVLGQSVRVSCSVSGQLHSQPRVRWRLNGAPYDPPRDSRARFRTFSDSELTVRASDSVRGTWTCVVNYRSSEGSASAQLDVNDIIEPPNDSSKVYAAVGSAASLPCVFSKGLKTSSVLWEREGEASASKPSAGTLPASFSPPEAGVSSQDGTAGLREVSFEDAGRYRCSINVGGFKMRRSMQLVTAKVAVEVLSEREPTLALTCDLSDTSDITGYEWIYKPSDLNGTGSEASVLKGRVVTSSEESVGQWICRFYGTHGVLGNVTYYVQHTAERLSEEQSKRASHHVAVLVGLAFLLLVLILTLNQMYRNYQRRKKILEFPALETIIHVRSVAREMNDRNQTKL